MDSKKMLRIGLPIVIALILIVGFVWFWSLGSVSASPYLPPIRLEAKQGTVEWKRAGEDVWQRITDGTDVRSGDEVRTGKDGAAEINWGDRGVTRLDASSDLVVETAPEDLASVTNTSIHLHILSGRIWSRMLKLLDIQSDVQARTNDVVATVRGTSFGLEAKAKDSELEVTDSVVSVSPTAGGALTMLREGEWGSFDTSGTLIKVRAITDKDAWAQANRLADASEETALRETFQNRISQWRGPFVHVPLWLVGLSERTHLMTLGGDKRAELQANYFERRLAWGLDQPDRLAAVMADQGSAFSVPGLSRERLLADIRLAVFTLPPSAARDTLAAGRSQLLQGDSAGLLYGQALMIDDQIDALIFPVQPLSDAEHLDRTKQLLDQIYDLEQRVKGTSDLSDDARAKLALKIAAMRRRLLDLGSDLNAIMPSTTTSTATSTLSVPTKVPTSITPQATSSKPTTTIPPATQPPPPAIAPPAVTQPTGPAFSSLLLQLSGPTTVGCQAIVPFRVLAVYTDGSSKDVTATAKASVSDTTLLTIQSAGSALSSCPRQASLASILASYSESGVSKSSSVGLTVDPQAKP